MADDQNQQAKTESDSAKDSAKDAQKAEVKAEQAADQAQAASDAAQEAVKESEKAEHKVQKAIEQVKEQKAVKEAPKVSKKLDGIISDIEKLSVLELSELVKALEAKFGVTAAAPTAVAAAGTPAAPGDEGTSEQTTFNVVLADGGANKISVIKAVREIVPTLGLKEAKDLVDAAPKPVLEGANKETANEAKAKLESAGAKVELK